MALLGRGRYLALLLGVVSPISAQTTPKAETVPKTTPQSPPKPEIRHSGITPGSTNTGSGGPARTGETRPKVGASGASGSGARPTTSGGDRNGSTKTPRLSNIYGHKSTADSPQPLSAPVEHASSERTTALTAPESRVALQQLNAMRSHLTGPNQRPLPLGNITVQSNGGRALSTADGRRYELRGNGTLASFHSGGQSASFSAKGHIVRLHSPAIDIRTGSDGQRTIISHRPDGSVLIGTGRHSGYLEKPLVLPGTRKVIQRTYVTNSVVYTRLYTPYSFHGVLLLHYVPEAYFTPKLYGWVYYPWKPVAFTFSFGSAPWYVANRGYFTPSPIYPSGYSWLADFDLSSVLEKCFDQRAGDEASTLEEGTSAAAELIEERENHLSADADTPITPTLKDAIAEEVRQQLAYANSAASGSEDLTSTELPVAMQPDHVFVVSSLLEVNAQDDQTCTLSGGDILQLTVPPGGDGAVAEARVASSKRADCPVGEIIAVSLQDLQEMQNDLRAEIDKGLRALRDNQGRDGWPAAPASAVAPPPRPAMDGLPPADPHVGELLEAQQHDAAQAKASVIAAAFAAR